MWSVKQAGVGLLLRAGSLRVGCSWRISLRRSLHMGANGGCSDTGSPSSSADGGTSGSGVGEPGSSSPERAGSGASSVITFLTMVRSLKVMKRQGWVNHGVQAPESIADHMYRMSLMALVTSDTPGIDRNRCVKMAVVHDVAEAIVGDITPNDGIPKEEKRRREAAAMDTLCSTLGPLGVEMRQLWEEYEEGSTKEARLVKDFDKVEMILQALEYEKEQGQDLQQFFNSTAGAFRTPIGQAYADEIRSRRDEWQASRKRDFACNKLSEEADMS